MTYAERLKDPRWQKRRLEIMSRDGFACQSCFGDEETLHVHHIVYRKKAMPWEYPDEDLVTLCESCHKTAESDRLVVLRAMSHPFYGDTITSCANAILNGGNIEGVSLFARMQDSQFDFSEYGPSNWTSIANVLKGLQVEIDNAINRAESMSKRVEK